MITTTKTKFTFFIFLICALGALSIPSKEKMGEYYFNSFRFDDAINALESNTGKISLKSLHILKEYYLTEGDIEKAIEIQLKILSIVPKNLEQIKEIIKLYDWDSKRKEAMLWKEKYAAFFNGREKQELLIEMLLFYQTDRQFNDAKRIAAMLKTFQNKESYRYLMAYYTTTNDLMNLMQVSIALKEMGQLDENGNGNEIGIASIYESNGDFAKSTQTYLLVLSPRDDLYDDKDWLSKINPKLIQDEKFTVYRIIKNYEREKKYDIVINSQLFLYQKDPTEVQLALEALKLSLKVSKSRTPEILNILSREKSAKTLGEIAYLFADVNDYEYAITYFEKALEADKTIKRYYNELTYLYETIGNIQKAYETQKRLLRLIDTPSKRINYINASEIIIAQIGGKNTIPKNEVAKTKRKIIEFLIVLKKDEELHAALMDYTKDYPLDLEIQKQLASSYIKKDRPDEAARIYAFITSAFPFDPEASLYLIDQKITAKDFEVASADLEKARSYVPAEEYTKRAITLSYELKDGRLDTLCLEKSLESESKVICHLHRKEYSEAITLLKASKNPYDKISLGYLLLDSKKPIEANIEIQKLEKNPAVAKRDLIGLKSYYDEVLLEQQYKHAKTILGIFALFNSPKYSFNSSNLVFRAPIRGTWFTGVQLYDQNYKSSSKSNIAPLIGLQGKEKSIQYRYGLLQGSHEVLGQTNLSEKSSLSGSLSLNTPFTDLYIVSFSKDIRRKNLLLDYFFVHNRHQLGVTYNFSKYSFKDNSFPEVTRQVLNSQYLYTHKNHFIQGLGLTEIQFSEKQIGGVDFSPLTLLSYRLGRNFIYNKFKLTPAATVGKDLRSSDGFGSIYSFEAMATYRFSFERYVSLFWEQRSIGQQNVSQKNTSLILNFNYWYY